MKRPTRSGDATRERRAREALGRGRSVARAMRASTVRARVRERRRTRARARGVMKLVLATVVVLCARAIFARWLTSVETLGGGEGEGDARGGREAEDDAAFADAASADPTRWTAGASEGGEGTCGIGGAAFGERGGTCANERSYPDLDVVTVAVKPSCVNAVAVAALNQYVGPRRIIVVTKDAERCASYESMASNVRCFEEDAFVRGVTKKLVGETLERLYGDELGADGAQGRFVGRELGGWYLQQLLKLGASTSDLINPVLSRRFLLWDLDMIPLRPLDLFHRDDAGTTQAVREIGGNVIKSYEPSYLDLTGEDMTYAADGTSYVTHQMVVDADVMKEMLDVFARKLDSAPTTFSMTSSMPRWATAILSSLDRTDLKLGFSEYASYASYAAKHHPERVYTQPKKTWARASGGKLGISLHRLLTHDGLCCPGPSVLALMKSRGFDYVGHEIGHVESCKYNSPEHEQSYGLPIAPRF